MPFHAKTIFESESDDSPWFAFRAWNRSATAMQPGDIVCFWNKTTGDAIATTGKLWVRLRSSGDACPGSNTFSQDPRYKVTGVVYGNSAAQSSAVAVVFGGRVSNLLCKSHVAVGEYLSLSDEQGAAFAAGLIAGGSGIRFGVALQASVTSSNTNREAFLFPWRV